MSNINKINYKGTPYDIEDKAAREGLTSKQDTLVSQTNIKSINSHSLLEAGDLQILLSECNNDSGFITRLVSDLENYYDKTKVDEMISAIPKFGIKVVPELPTENISSSTIYLVKDINVENNLYTEYIYIDSKWEKLGEQKVDLKGYATEQWVQDQSYATESSVNDKLTSKADKQETANSLANKLDKVNETEKVYATTTLGDQTTIQYNVDAIGDGLAKRTSSGTLKVADPTQNDEATTKKYVDEYVQPNQILTGSEDSLLSLKVNGINYKLAPEIAPIIIDSSLSDTSNNPVQNKVIKAELDKKLSEVPAEYITETELDDKKYLVAKDIENKADLSYVNQQLASKANNTDVINKADKATTLSGYGIEDAYTKTQVNELVSSVYKYKGSKPTKNDLPADGNTIGDVWNVEETDKNYAWDGTKWDDLGGIQKVNLDDYYTQTQVNNLIQPKADTTYVDEKIQDLEHDKVSVHRYTLGSTKLTQLEATDIINQYGNFEGKLIEFLTNGDAPNKTVGYGYVCSNGDGDQFLITLANDGTSRQWNKTNYLEHNVKFKMNVGMTDCDIWTIDEQGQPPMIVGGLEKAFNKPEGSGWYGTMLVIYYNSTRQLQIYYDTDNGNSWTRTINGTPDRHEFGRWFKVGGSGGSGGGSLNVESDTDGNLVLGSTGGISASDDGNGNVILN